jgi:hypothetical protein
MLILEEGYNNFKKCYSFYQFQAFTKKYSRGLNNNFMLVDTSPPHSRLTSVVPSPGMPVSGGCIL